jgi:hypothetical protein
VRLRSSLLVLGIFALSATAISRFERPASPVPTFSCGFIKQPLSVAAVMPKDFIAGNQQAGADCMAWQEFIYLNWRADPNIAGEPDFSAGAAAFGVPNNTTTVWQTYPLASAVFVPGSTLRNSAAAAMHRLKRLSTTSELGDIVLSGISQAGNDAWLTDQTGGLTYYEVYLDRDEAEYVSLNHVQTAAGQLQCAQAAGGFSLPAGGAAGNIDYTCAGAPAVYGDNFGALEIKAAWIELKDPSRYSRYLIANALIQPPNTPPHTGVVGLVGLHVIHKVPSAQQFVWATFEHVDNDPEAPLPPAPLPPAPLPPAPPAFTYYNPACNPQTDHYHCLINHEPSAAPADPYNAPVQVVRINSVGRKTAMPANSYVWSQLPTNSVFRNYRLIDVLWPNQNTPITPGAVVPLAYGNSISEKTPLVNTTLETYFQGPSPAALSCLNCHTSAPIAMPAKLVHNALGRPARLLRLPPRNAKSGSGIAPASDYSFVFFNLGH